MMWISCVQSSAKKSAQVIHNSYTAPSGTCQEGLRLSKLLIKRPLRGLSTASGPSNNNYKQELLRIYKD